MGVIGVFRGGIMGVIRGWGWDYGGIKGGRGGVMGSGMGWFGFIAEWDYGIRWDYGPYGDEGNVGLRGIMGLRPHSPPQITMGRPPQAGSAPEVAAMSPQSECRPPIIP